LSNKTTVSANEHVEKTFIKINLYIESITLRK